MQNHKTGALQRVYCSACGRQTAGNVRIVEDAGGGHERLLEIFCGRECLRSFLARWAFAFGRCPEIYYQEVI